MTKIGTTVSTVTRSRELCQIRKISTYLVIRAERSSAETAHKVIRMPVLAESTQHFTADRFIAQSTTRHVHNVQVVLFAVNQAFVLIKVGAERLPFAVNKSPH